jgi:hypothetical protein
MIANVYEKTYVSVTNGLSHTEYLDKLVEIMRANREPMTCAKLGHSVFGERYDSEYMGKSLSARMGQMLKHLRQGGFIKVDLIDGAPVEVSSWEWVDPVDAPPSKIRVHDDEGNEYWIANPKYDFRRQGGKYEEVKKTITPKIKVYYWAAE